MSNEQKGCKDWYNKDYLEGGFKSQRLYPNEELCRFLGREFFSLANSERKTVKILEIGCGSCSNLWMIANEGFQAYGIDLSNVAINLGKQMLEKWNVSAKLENCSMTNLPYDNDSFDAIVDVFSAYCLCEEDFITCLEEITRTLKKGGKFFSYTPSTNSDAFKNYEPSKKIDDFTLNGIKRETSPYFGNNYAFRFISPERYKALLENNGLTVKYIELISRSYREMNEFFEFITIVGEK